MGEQQVILTLRFSTERSKQTCAATKTQLLEMCKNPHSLLGEKKKDTISYHELFLHSLEGNFCQTKCENDQVLQSLQLHRKMGAGGATHDTSEQLKQ